MNHEIHTAAVRSLRIEERWSHALLREGFTAIPTFVLRNMWRLDPAPTSTEALCLFHLASFRRSNESVFIPTKWLGAQLGLKPSGMRKVVRSLEQKGLIEATLHRGTRTLYDITPFVRKMDALISPRRVVLREPPANEDPFAPHTPASARRPPEDAPY